MTCKPERMGRWSKIVKTIVRTNKTGILLLHALKYIESFGFSVTKIIDSYQKLSKSDKNHVKNCIKKSRNK